MFVSVTRFNDTKRMGTWYGISHVFPFLLCSNAVKYAHVFCFVMICVGQVTTKFYIFFRVISIIQDKSPNCRWIKPEEYRPIHLMDLTWIDIMTTTKAQPNYVYIIWETLYIYFKVSALEYLDIQVILLYKWEILPWSKSKERYVWSVEQWLTSISWYLGDLHIDSKQIIRLLLLVVVWVRRAGRGPSTTWNCTISNNCCLLYRSEKSKVPSVRILKSRGLRYCDILVL